MTIVCKVVAFVRCFSINSDLPASKTRQARTKKDSFRLIIVFIIVSLILIFGIGCCAGFGLMIVFLPSVNGPVILRWTEYRYEFLIGAFVLGGCAIGLIVSGFVLVVLGKEGVPNRRLLLFITLSALLGGLLLVSPVLAIWFLALRSHHWLPTKKKETINSIPKLKASRIKKEVSPLKNSTIIVWLILIFGLGSCAGVGLMVTFLPTVTGPAVLRWTEYRNEFLIGALVLGICVICSIVSGLVLFAQSREGSPDKLLLLFIALSALLSGLLIVSPILVICLLFRRSYRTSLQRKKDALE